MAAKKTIGLPADDAGRFVLRVALGVPILFHGISKVIGGIGGVAELLARLGLPHWIGYQVYVGEVIAPALIVVGIWTRPAALAVAINRVVALLLAHTSQLFRVSGTGGWALELQGMHLAAAVAVMLLGAGRYSLGGAGGRFN